VFDDYQAVARLEQRAQLRGIRHDERVVHYDTMMLAVGCQAERATPPERSRFRWFW
jgi:hypothetical protein